MNRRRALGALIFLGGIVVTAACAAAPHPPIPTMVPAATAPPASSNSGITPLADTSITYEQSPLSTLPPTVLPTATPSALRYAAFRAGFADYSGSADPSLVRVGDQLLLSMRISNESSLDFKAIDVRVKAPWSRFSYTVDMPGVVKILRGSDSIDLIEGGPIAPRRQLAAEIALTPKSAGKADFEIDLLDADGQPLIDGNGNPQIRGFSMMVIGDPPPAATPTLTIFQDEAATPVSADDPTRAALETAITAQANQSER